jgi:predicted nuclease of predicted toxin-antitoxin system
LKVKLDENLDRQGADLLQAAGHDVATASNQGLQGASDRGLIETCRAEGCCLVTLDLEFGNPLLFRPSEFPGVVVLRLPRKPTPDDLFAAIRTPIVVSGRFGTGSGGSNGTMSGRGLWPKKGPVPS